MRHFVATVAAVSLIAASTAAARPADGARPAPARPSGKRAAPTPPVTFRGIGDLPGGRVHSEALGVSEDGRVVFGEGASARSADGTEAFLWTDKDRMRPLGGAFPPPVQSQPRGSTPDGKVLVGHSIAPGGMPIATIWKGSTAPQSLGDLPGGGEASGALAVSADGALVVGWGSSAAGLEAARWLGGAPAEPLGDLAGGEFHSAAALIARDKKSIVGTGTTAAGQEIAVWSGADVRGLGDLPGGEVASEPFAMTPKGDVVVGRGASAGCMQAARWTAATGLEGLGDLPGGPCESIALGVSSDGSVVVGYASTDAGQEAFVWTRSAGLRSLRALLLAAGAGEVEGWQLRVANGVSGDGRVIVGGGIDPAGTPEGWVVRLPSSLR